MANSNNPQISDDVALIFDLPDGDHVVLPTWEYIVAKLSEVIEPIIQTETRVNTSLDLIETKIDSWLPEEEED